MVKYKLKFNSVNGFIYEAFFFNLLDYKKNLGLSFEMHLPKPLHPSESENHLEICIFNKQP